MTMSLLVLEGTHDFEITATVLSVALCSSAFVRDRFGNSFQTWRLHLRGEVVRSARDIGWMRALTAQRLIRSAPPTAAAYVPTLDGTSAVGDLAILKEAFLGPDDAIGEIMPRFEESEADDLAVVSASGTLLGILTEKYVQRRYADKADRALRELYGEG